MDKSLNLARPVDASVFETTIRVAGGLMAAFYLSDDPMFLAKAKVGQVPRYNVMKLNITNITL